MPLPTFFFPTPHDSAPNAGPSCVRPVTTPPRPSPKLTSSTARDVKFSLAISSMPVRCRVRSALSSSYISGSVCSRDRAPLPTVPGAGAAAAPSTPPAAADGLGLSTARGVMTRWEDDVDVPAGDAPAGRPPAAATPRRAPENALAAAAGGIKADMLTEGKMGGGDKESQRREGKKKKKKSVGGGPDDSAEEVGRDDGVTVRARHRGQAPREVKTSSLLAELEAATTAACSSLPIPD